MRQLLTIIVTFAIVLHSTLGCCSHHAHGAKSNETTSAKHAGATPCSAHAAHGKHFHPAVAVTESSEQAPADQRPTDCEEGDCSFARTEASPEVPSVLLDNYLSVLDYDSTSFDRKYNSPTHAEYPPADSPPRKLRLHIALRVLLI